MCFCCGVPGGGAGEAFMKRYVEQSRLPEHARYRKAKEMVEKKVGKENSEITPCAAETRGKYIPGSGVWLWIL